MIRNKGNEKKSTSSLVLQRTPRLAERSGTQRRWKMVLELRTDGVTPLGCDGSARDSV